MVTWLLQSENLVPILGISYIYILKILNFETQINDTEKYNSVINITNVTNSESFFEIFHNNMSTKKVSSIYVRNTYVFNYILVVKIFYFQYVAA